MRLDKTNYPLHQQGAVLIVSLILLLVMTLIGVTAMQTTTMEEKMAGNMRDQNFAFQAAESAIRDAEDFIENSIVSTAGFGTTAGLFSLANAEPDYTLGTTWTTAANYRTYGTNTGALALSDVASQPRYFIKIITVGAPGSTLWDRGQTPHGRLVTGGINLTVFRITARGTGLSNDSQVILRSYYARYIN